MSVRRILWPVGGFLAISSLALLTPQSPLYFPELLASRLTYGGKSTGFWVDSLKSSDPEVRRQAIKAVGAIGPKAIDAVPTLAQIVAEHEDREFRNEAALALTKMAPASKGAVPQLTKALEDEEGPVRMNACMALFRLEKEAYPAVPTLIKLIADERNNTNVKTFQYTIQELGMLTLAKATAGTDEAVDLLKKKLVEAKTPDTMIASTRALGFVGPPAKTAEAEISKLLKDPNQPIRETAEEALERIGIPAQKKS